jgi:anhydro-N-acetylmuramic acid kinase
MVYKVIGLMSGSSLDGLDIAYVHLQERASTSGPRSWEFQLVQADCLPYSAEWRERLAGATGLSALDYQITHTDYGQYLGQQVLRFMAAHGLEYKVQLIASHGHTTFHAPARRMTAQLGDGAAIAAVTRINVVSDLRAMDVALGGQGAPIVPVGERALWSDFDLFLNLGGIANISRREGSVAFDVVPANRVLNELAGDAGLGFDRDGLLAASGRVDAALLESLDSLDYYGMGYPKSLANEFGLEVVLPLVRATGLSNADALRTYVGHVVGQIGWAVEGLRVAHPAGGGGMEDRTGGGGMEARTGGEGIEARTGGGGERMLVTGGGAHNRFLVELLRERLAEMGVEVIVPEPAIVDFKEALVMALIGVLRWREENNVFASVTGAVRDSIGGAVWIGQEA